MSATTSNRRIAILGGMGHAAVAWHPGSHSAVTPSRSAPEPDEPERARDVA